uniref:Uncharacterized protein n=1 Tax=Anguilla anguilla TaxID=7936 RepID=A0A0E9V5C5_ANGAN
MSQFIHGYLFPIEVSLWCQRVVLSLVTSCRGNQTKVSSDMV